MPSPGWTGEADWPGFVPFEELPRAVDPAEGLIINANNRIVSDDHPHWFGGDWPEPFRAERIIEVLEAKTAATVESSFALQMDAIAHDATLLMPLLLKRLPGDAGPRDLVRAMASWNGEMTRDLPEPLIYHAWFRALAIRIYADELGRGTLGRMEVRPRALARALTEPEIGWCGEDGCAADVAAAFDDALAELRETYGERWREWRWGEAHKARFRHVAFGRIPVLRDLFDITAPADGSNHTVNRGGMRLFAQHSPYEQVHGAGMRAVYDLADLDRSRFVQAPGQSGNALSPHRRDMLDLWLDGGSLTLGPLDRPSHVLRLAPPAGG